MASLPEFGNSSKLPMKQGSSSNKPSMESSPTSSFPNTEFDDYNLQPSHGPWHQGSVVQLETSFSFGEDQSDTQRLLPTSFASTMDNYGNPQFGSPVVGPCTWDNKISCMSAANALAGNPLFLNGNPLNITGLGQGHMNIGLDYMHMGMEHMHAAGHTHINGDVPLRKMMMLPQSSASELFKQVNWTASLDPSNHGLSAQAVSSLGASHCIPNLPADPGFADRAARFSPFGNMGHPVAHLAGDPIKDNKVKLNQMKHGGHCTVRKPSAPSSPTGFDHGNRNNAQEKRGFPSKETSPADPMEESNRTLNMLVDGDEGAQKPLCASVNESDESMGQEASSSCERNVGGGGGASVQGLLENIGRKRKAGSQKLKDGGGGFPATKKELDPDEGRSKCQLGSDNYGFEKSPKPQLDQSNSGNSGESTPKSVKESSKPPEAPKPDFIHVRARRGQATDSHSLAERVRREKISERMKFLQDLVPGCSKVTGKAVMLDEIINYVQSLQRQVEFLSMKLASLNPRMEFNIENLFGRERPVQPKLATPASVFGLDSSNLYPPLHPLQQPHGPLQPLAGQGPPPPIDAAQPFGLDPALRRTISAPVSTDAYMDSDSQQVSQAWDDDLQSVVQMSFAQRQAVLDMQGHLFHGQMKVEH